MAAAARLDDYKSSVMDIAVAIEPLCSAKEETMIDAINKEFLDKNTGIAANMSMKEMERVRQDRTDLRQKYRNAYFSPSPEAVLA